VRCDRAQAIDIDQLRGDRLTQHDVVETLSQVSPPDSEADAGLRPASRSVRCEPGASEVVYRPNVRIHEVPSEGTRHERAHPVLSPPNIDCAPLARAYRKKPQRKAAIRAASPAQRLRGRRATGPLIIAAGGCTGGFAGKQILVDLDREKIRRRPATEPLDFPDPDGLGLRDLHVRLNGTAQGRAAWVRITCSTAGQARASTRTCPEPGSEVDSK
jgi:hypothetical protein